MGKFLNMGSVSRKETESKIGDFLGTVDTGIEASGQNYQRDIGETYADRLARDLLLSPAHEISKVTAAASHLMGKDDFANNLMDNVGKSSGYNLDGESYTAGGFAGLPGMALPTGVASKGISVSARIASKLAEKMPGRIGTSAARKNIITQADESILSRFSKDTTISTGLSPFQETSVDTQGNANYVVDSLSDSLKTMIIEAAGGAPIDAALTTATTVPGRIRDQKIINKFKKSGSARLDKVENISALANQELFEELGKSNIDINRAVNIVDPDGTNKIGVITKNGKLEMLSEEGQLELTQNEAGDIVTKETNGRQRKVKRLINDKAMGSVSSIDSVPSKQVGSFIDDSGRVLIQGEGIGRIRGTLDSDGSIDIDIANSEITSKLAKLKINGKKVLTFSELKKAADEQPSTITPSDTDQEYQEFGDMTSEASGAVKTFDTNGIEEIGKATGNEKIAKAITKTIDNLNSNERISDISENIEKEITKIATDINLKDIGSNIDKNTVDQLFDISNATDTEPMKIMGVKKEFKNAIKLAIADKIASMRSEQLKSGKESYKLNIDDISDLGKSIMKKAIDIMATSRNVPRTQLDSLGNKLDITEYLTNTFKKEGVQNETAMGVGGVKESVIFDKDKIDEIADVFTSDKDREKIFKIIENKRDKYSINKSGKSKAGMWKDSEFISNHAKEMSKEGWRFTDLIDEDGNIDQNQLDDAESIIESFKKMSDEDLTNMFLKQESNEVRAKISEVEYESSIKEFRKEIEEIENILKGIGDKGYVTFDTKVTVRSIYEGNVNPESSKILRYLLRSKNTKRFDIKTEKHRKLIVNHYNDVMKTEHKSIEDIFESRGKDSKAALSLEQKILGQIVSRYKSVDDFSKYKAAVDSKTSNVTLMVAVAKLFNISGSDIDFSFFESLGISDNKTNALKENKQDSTPSVIEAFIKKEFDIDITRDDAKEIAIPKFYGSGDAGAANNLVNAMIDKYLSGGTYKSGGAFDKHALGTMREYIKMNKSLVDRFNKLVEKLVEANDVYVNAPESSQDKSDAKNNYNKVKKELKEYVRENKEKINNIVSFEQFMKQESSFAIKGAKDILDTEGIRLGEADKFKERVANFISDSVVEYIVKSSMQQIYSKVPGMQDFMNKSEAFFRIMKHAAASRIRTKNISGINAIKTVESFGIDSNKLSRNKSYSAMFIMEYVQQRSNIDFDQLIAHPVINNEVLKIQNPFGDPVPLVSIAGNQIYNSDLGVVMKGLSTSFLTLPNFIISMDASIASRVFNGINVFDATYGGAEILDSATRANASIMDLLLNTNIYDLYANELSKIDYNNLYNLTEEDNFIAQDLGIANKTSIDTSKITMQTRRDLDIITDSSYTYSLEDPFNSEIKAINEKIENLKSKDIYVNNYTVGTSDFVATKDHGFDTQFIERDYSPKRKYAETVVDQLRNVSYVDEKEEYTRFNISDRDIDYVIKLFHQESKNIAQAAARNVGLQDFDLNPASMRKAIHEMIHVMMDANNNIANSEMTERFIDTIVENFEYNDSLFDLKDKANQKPRLEFATMILERLVFNNFMRDNKEIYANMFKTNDLSSFLVDNDGNNVLIDKHGNIIDSIETLAYMMRNRYKSPGTSSYGANIYRAAMNHINNLDQTKSAFVNFDLITSSKIESVLNFRESASGRIMSTMTKDKFNSLLDVTTDIIEETSFLNAFDMSTTMEAMRKAIQKEKHITSLVEAVASQAKKEVESIEAKHDIKTEQDKERAHNIAGKIIVSGIGQFFTEFAASFNGGDTVVGFIDKIQKQFFTRVYGKNSPYINAIKKEMNIGELNQKKPREAVEAIFNSVYKNFGKGKFARSDAVKLMAQQQVKKFDLPVKSLDGVIKDLERYIAIKNLMQRKDNGAYKLTETFNDIENFVSESDSNKAFLDDILALHDATRDSDTIYGANLEYNLQRNNKSVAAVSEASEKFKDIKKDDLIGYAQDDNGNKYKIIAKTSPQYTFLKEDSHIINLDVSDYEKGYLKVKKSNMYIYLNPTKAKLGNRLIDYSAKKMITRNAYIKAVKGISKAEIFKQIKILKDNDVLVTKDRIPEGKSESYRKITKKDNPRLAEYAGSGYYFNKRFEQYIMDSQGFNLDKISKNLGGARQAVNETFRWLVDATEMMKRVILLATPSVVINNFIGTSIQTLMHAENIATLPQDMYRARVLMKDFRELMNKYSQAVIKGSKEDVQAAKKTMEEHELWGAFENGVFETLRTDAYNNRTYKELSIIGSINNIDKSGKIGSFFNHVFFDPSTRNGKFMGEVFDQTEIIPKIALYLNMKDKSVDYKAQKIQYAYPTYNNLNALGSTIDQIWPFTKYMVNYPKMLMYTASTRLMPLALAHAGFFTIQSKSWELDDEKEKHEFYKDFNMAYIPGLDVGYYVGSMLMPNLMSIPSKSMNGELFGEPFIYSALSSIYNDPIGHFIPGTSLK